MANCNDNKNPLQRSGTSQLQRQLPGLAAGYARVDENEFDNWIVFAAQFAEYVRYYEQSDTEVAGTWAAFFNNDVSALLGSIAVQQVDIYQTEIKKRFDFLKDNDNAADTAALKRNLSELFSAILTLAKAMDGYLGKIITRNNLSSSDQQLVLQQSLLNVIASKLEPSLKRLLGYYKAASQPPLNYVLGGGVSHWQILNSTVAAASTIINGEGLSVAWWGKYAASSIPDVDKTWAKYYNSIAPDDSIFKTPGLSVTLDISDGTNASKVFQRIHHAANHNLLAAVFDQFLMAHSRLIADAERELLKTLEQWDSHPPHYALFLSFLKLFRHAQDSLNTLTQRHLDYYYREVLQILPKEALPSHAHVLVELAKQTDAWSLAASEQLRAGKDSGGKEILFALDKAETFNKAAAVAFKSVYMGTTADNHGTVINQGRLFASPIANSADGLGAELVSDNKEWHPFVNKLYTEDKLTDIATPNAQIGFAVASHYLLLTEGKRRVRLRLQTNQNSELLKAQGHISCFLTTEKGWYEVLSNITISNGLLSSTGQACAEIAFVLPGEAPATANYNAKVHGGTFACTTPILKILLKNEDSAEYKYDLLADIDVTIVEVKVEVGMDTANWNQDGLKALHLSNDGGPLDPAKPFAPFGANPAKETTFAIGHKEPFSKKGAAVRLHLQWANLPTVANHIKYSAPNDTDATAPQAVVHYLGGGVWTPRVAQGQTTPEQIAIFSGVATNVVLFGTAQKIPDKAIRNYADADVPYNTKSTNGFMRLVLNDSFGYKKYLTDFSVYLINKANNVADTSNPRPEEPYSPLLQSVYMSYEAHTASDVQAVSHQHFDDRQLQFFHLGPFGEAEQHAVLASAEQAPTTVSLVPLFSRGTTGAGEFYIGLQNLAPRQSVSLLFQVLEGSADPLLPKPDSHIQWSYLGNNHWHNFQSQDISDATRQLVQSGIIQLAIPSNAGTQHTIMPNGHIWLRAAVTQYAEAVCALLGVHAQAAPVTLLPNGNADEVLSSALPAESIAKLKTPVASVKKIIQPYPGFGGRAKETDQQFYTRVSERLRHKGRAITIWDYEHLVLQAFPQIHKVKCLNHTQFANTASGVAYNEVKPGHVTIITIPNLVNRNDVNPLKPYTNQSLLLEIKEYLQQRISCHVQLEVANPQFEEVKLKFDLKLASGYTDFTFYSKQLQQEITNYLTPWAFSQQAEVQFGGKVYKSSLINFIEERYYVEFITNVEMFHKIPDKAESGNQEEIVASTARSILVSARVSAHDIQPVKETAGAGVATCDSINAT
jgi:hypothetical protein